MRVVWQTCMYRCQCYDIESRVVRSYSRVYSRLCRLDSSQRTWGCDVWRASVCLCVLLRTEARNSSVSRQPLVYFRLNSSSLNIARYISSRDLTTTTTDVCLRTSSTSLREKWKKRTFTCAELYIYIYMYTVHAFYYIYVYSTVTISHTHTHTAVSTSHSH